jgi:hypothetical protein
VFSTYVYPTVCFGTHRHVLCFGMDCMGGELIYSFAQFFFQIFSTLLLLLCGSVRRGRTRLQWNTRI